MIDHDQRAAVIVQAQAAMSATLDGLTDVRAAAEAVDLADVEAAVHAALVAVGRAASIIDSAARDHGLPVTG